MGDPMADVRDLAARDQPAPAGGAGDVWAEVLRDRPHDPARAIYAGRRELGIARYGQPLRRGDGRDHWRDLVEELADAVAYARAVEDRELEERVVGCLHSALARRP